jgi:DNA repair protein RadC
MAAPKDPVHAGHRERFKRRFINEGLSGFSDHEALELLLYYSIPQKDTNVLAHRLIDEFGSLDAVFDAPVDALMNVNGVGVNTAILLKLVHPIYGKSVESRNTQSKTVIDNIESATSFFKPLLFFFTVVSVEV